MGKDFSSPHVIPRYKDGQLQGVDTSAGWIDLGDVVKLIGGLDNIPQDTKGKFVGVSKGTNEKGYPAFRMVVWWRLPPNQPITEVGGNEVERIGTNGVWLKEAFGYDDSSSVTQAAPADPAVEDKKSSTPEAEEAPVKTSSHLGIPEFG